MVESIIVKDCTLKKDIWLINMLRTETLKIIHHPGVNQCIKTQKHITVGKNDIGYTVFVNRAIEMEYRIAKQISNLQQKTSIVIIACRHSIGHKAWYTQLGKFLHHSAFSAPNTTCDTNLLHLMTMHCTSFGSMEWGRR